jgi:hypothetical protein
LNVTTVDLTAPSTPSSLESSNITENSIDLVWSASNDNVGVVNYEVYQDNSIIGSTSSTSFTSASLTSDTIYDFYVVAVDAAGNSSKNSDVASIRTNASNPSSGSNDLFISEYVEGSSNNKGIEIANYTGNVVDLSMYDLRKNTNGGSSWGSIYALSGTLADGEVFVIVNSSAQTAMTNIANVTTGAGIVTFNGNDPIGLFKNGNLIDLVGNFGSSDYFAQNQTLRRIATVTNPNPIFSISEWEVFSQDNFDDLGGHSIDLEPNSTILLESFFESGWDSWIDGGGDCTRYSGVRSYEGNYSIRIRDNSSTASSMTSSEFDITGFESIETTFYFYAYSMENGEDFWFRYHDGSSWQTIKAWSRGTDFDNNNFYAATVSMDASTYNFVNNGKFRFQCDASGNADHIYIDQVTIKGIQTGNKNLNHSKSKGQLVLISSLNTDNDLIGLYPNPLAGNTLFVNADIEDQEEIPYRIISLLGRVIKTGKIRDSQIDLGNLKAGIYQVELMLNDEKVVKKLIKK